MGTRTRPPGSAGPTTLATGSWRSSRSSPGSTVRWCGKFRRMRTVRLIVRHQADENLARRDFKAMWRGPAGTREIVTVTHPTNRVAGRAGHRANFRQERNLPGRSRKTGTETAITSISSSFRLLGQIHQLAQGHDASRRPPRASLKIGLFHAECHVLPALRHRRRRHGVERTRHLAHHRGMLPRPQYPSPQSRPRAQRNRDHAAKVSRRRKNVFWLAKGPVGDDTHGPH